MWRHVASDTQRASPCCLKSGRCKKKRVRTFCGDGFCSFCDRTTTVSVCRRIACGALYTKPLISSAHVTHVAACGKRYAESFPVLFEVGAVQKKRVRTFCGDVFCSFCDRTTTASVCRRVACAALYTKPLISSAHVPHVATCGKRYAESFPMLFEVGAVQKKRVRTF
jgi:hypothetical protein